MAVMGSYCSAATIAMVPVFIRFKVPVVVWAAVLPAITYGQKTTNINRVSATLINQNRVAAQFLVKDQKYKRWAALYDTTDYGREMFRYFDQFLKDGVIDVSAPSRSAASTPPCTRSWPSMLTSRSPGARDGSAGLPPTTPPPPGGYWSRGSEIAPPRRRLPASPRPPRRAPARPARPPARPTPPRRHPPPRPAALPIARPQREPRRLRFRRPTSSSAGLARPRAGRV